ncbi:MAG: molybdopterin-dependent oxidoreductase [Pirellulales bacterium]|nr:molybdopterin-dependent oxidoreductase [Pirellulales bacterium]
MARTVFRACHLCEAACGLAIEVEADRIVAVRGDQDDPFSQGYLCPKGASIAGIHDDPDRLRTPMRRTADGRFEPISWGEAFELVGSRFNAIRQAHGADALALYAGNPLAHNHGLLALRNSLIRALGTRNVSGASSQDTAPRFATSYYLYGASLVVPVPDIDRTDYFLCIGANPRASNGSFMTAPDVRRRLKALRDRGGKLVVVDPRRTETAREADEHVAILPGGDAAFLLAMIHVLLVEGRVDRAAIAQQATGWHTVEERIRYFAPERVAPHVGLDAGTIRRLAREFAAAPTSVAYSRVGVCNNRYGTVATYATDLLNLAAGRLGAVGGWMFPRPPFDNAPLLKLTGDGHARWHSRVRHLPETLGELPASTLAEEIETPGPGQVRALLTVAGNPVLSTPNSRRLDAALGRLEFMASVDIYINETTRHADVILPPAWGLCEEHMDVIFSMVAVRQVVRTSPAVVPVPDGQLNDWQIVLELIYRLGGGPTGIAAIDRCYRLAHRLGLDRWRPEPTLDLLLRIGPHGDRFLPWSQGLNLKKLRRAEHGLDLGPLKPGVAHRILHHDKTMHVDAPPLLAAVDRLAQELREPPAGDELLMIGRRDLRSNNSWMHNVPELVSGRERCVLLVHPDDARERNLRDGDLAVLENHVHRGEVRVKLSDDMRPGVICLPHGWGHAPAAEWQRVAGQHPGVSFNDWADDQDVESVVGESILNGVRIRLSAALPVSAEPLHKTRPAVTNLTDKLFAATR